MIAGIDPGVTGAIAIFEYGLKEIHDMPTYDGRVDGIELGALLENVDIVYLENTHPMPKNGSIASYKLGLNTGIVIGVVQSMMIPLVRVSVAQWRAGVGLRGKDKDASLGLARELFPHMRSMLTRQRDHNRAEAALIGRYGAYRQIQERKAHDEGEDVARSEGDGALRGGLGEDRHPAGRTPGHQQRAQEPGRRGDRVAEVRPLVRSGQDSHNGGGEAG